MNYREMSIAGLEALVAELRDILREKRGEPSKSTLAGLVEGIFGTREDYLGTGLSMEEHFALEAIKRYERSWEMQSRDEQNRRLDLVIRLSGEYQRVRQQTVQSGAFGRRAIQYVWSGDWKELEFCRDLLTFKDEPEPYRSRYRSIYAEFVNILDEALRTVPAPPTPAEAAKS